MPGQAFKTGRIAALAAIVLVGCADGEIVERLILDSHGDAVARQASPTSAVGGVDLASSGDRGDVTLLYTDTPAGQGERIVARRLDVKHADFDDEVEVRAATPDHIAPIVSCALDSVGSFVAAWAEATAIEDLPEGTVALDPGNVRAALRLAGAAEDEPDFQVNDSSIGVQSAPAIACLDDGGFIVAWQSECTAVERDAGGGAVFSRPQECDQEPPDGVYLQRYDAMAQPDAGPLRVEPGGGATARAPVLAPIAGVGFALLAVLDGEPSASVLLQTYNLAGQLVRELVVGGAPTDTAGLRCPRNGRCIALWADEDGILATIVPPGLGVEISRLRVKSNESAADHALLPALDCDSKERCMVTWYLEGIAARALNDSTQQLGPEIRVADAPEAGQQRMPVASVAPGRFVAAWQQDGFVILQRFTLR